MQKYPLQPILTIVFALVAVGGSLWIIHPTVGLFSLLATPGPAKEYRYAARPVGLDGPAGQCVVCHSLEKHGPLRVAPTLWGIVGAPKAGGKGYGYSHALLTAGGVWSESDLNDYLSAPDRFLPGTKKTLLGLADPKERARIVQFLGTLRD